MAVFALLLVEIDEEKNDPDVHYKGQVINNESITFFNNIIFLAIIFYCLV